MNRLALLSIGALTAAAMAAEPPPRLLVPTQSPHLGTAVSDPLQLPFYIRQHTLQFSDGLLAHTVHDATDGDGVHHLVVLVQGVARGNPTRWEVVADQMIEPPPNTVFVGSNAEIMGCKVNHHPALAFGFLEKTETGFSGDGKRIIGYILDPSSNLIPMVGFPVFCRAIAAHQ